MDIMSTVRMDRCMRVITYDPQHTNHIMVLFKACELNFDTNYHDSYGCHGYATLCTKELMNACTHAKYVFFFIQNCELF